MGTIDNGFGIIGYILASGRDFPLLSTVSLTEIFSVFFLLKH